MASGLADTASFDPFTSSVKGKPMTTNGATHPYYRLLTPHGTVFVGVLWTWPPIALG